MQVSFTAEPHAARLADYVADGYEPSDYVHDHLHVCPHCLAIYDDAEADGEDEGYTCGWVCFDCIIEER